MSWSNQSKTATTFDDGLDYLLKQDSGFLLLESGYKILLDQSPNAKFSPTWTDQSKN